MTNSNDIDIQKTTPPKISSSFLLLLCIIAIPTLILFCIIDFMKDNATYIDYDLFSDFKLTVIVGMDRTISIRNNSLFDWEPRECDGGNGILFFIGNDYTYLYPNTIKPREIIKIHLDDFKNKYGKAFQFPAAAVKSMTIFCNEGLEIVDYKDPSMLYKEIK